MNLIDIDFSTISNLNDFTIVNPNSTMGLYTTGGTQYLQMINIPGTGNFANYIRYNAFGGISSKYWDSEIVFTPRIKTSTSYGITNGLASINSLDNSDYRCIAYTSNIAGTTGKIASYLGGVGKTTSSTALSWNANDRLKLRISRIGNKFFTLFQNLSGFTFTPPTITDYVSTMFNFPNSIGYDITIGMPALHILGGQIDIEKWTIDTRLQKKPRGIAIGDSLTHGFYLDNDQKTYPIILSELTGKQFFNYGSTSTTTNMWLSGMTQIITQQPEKLYICLGRNDIGQNIPSATTLNNLATIILSATTNGIDYRIISLLPDSTLSGGTAINLLNNVINNLYPDKFIDINYYFNNGSNGLKPQYTAGDLVHWTEATHVEIAKLIFESGNI